MEKKKPKAILKSVSTFQGMHASKTHLLQRFYAFYKQSQISKSKHQTYWIQDYILIVHK